MKLFLLKLPILFGFIVAACGTQDSVNLPVSDSAESYQKLAEAPSTEQPAPPAEFSERKIIREGDIYFECRDIQETDAFLKAEVNAAKGFISNESENSYGERSEKRLTIRIPSDQLDPLLEKKSNPMPYVSKIPTSEAKTSPSNLSMSKPGSRPKKRTRKPLH